MSEGKPGTPNRVIRGDRATPEQSLIRRDALVAAERARTAIPEGIPRVVTDYFPRRPLPAGDPASPSGEYVAEEELDVDLRAKVNFAGQLMEIALTFPDQVPPGTAINIQDGTYSTGGPASIEGDIPLVGGPIRSPLVTLPPTGVEFKEDGRISVILNGQELERGDGSGNGDAEWVSPTQIRLVKIIYTNNVLIVRAPVVPPSPTAL